MQLADLFPLGPAPRLRVRVPAELRPYLRPSRHRYPPLVRRRIEDGGPLLPARVWLTPTPDAPASASWRRRLVLPRGYGDPTPTLDAVGRWHLERLLAYNERRGGAFRISALPGERSRFVRGVALPDNVVELARLYAPHLMAWLWVRCRGANALELARQAAGEGRFTAYGLWP